MVIAEVAYALDVKLEDVLVNNIKKLKKRFPNGFNTNMSINREDKN